MLGSSIPELLLLISTEFIVLVGVALAVATPITYFTMSHWLQDFHYRIDIDLLIFPMAGGLALFITLLTISYQARKAALADPAKSLRDE